MEEKLRELLELGDITVERGDTKIRISNGADDYFLLEVFGIDGISKVCYRKSGLYGSIEDVFEYAIKGLKGRSK